VNFLLLFQFLPKKVKKPLAKRKNVWYNRKAVQNGTAKNNRQSSAMLRTNAQDDKEEPKWI